MVSCKTKEDIPKGMIFDVAKALENVVVTAPVAIGDVVLADLLRDHDLLPTQKQTLDLFIASFSTDMKQIFKTANIFRQMGFNVSHPLSPIKLGKQMELANQQGATCVVYVDGENAKEGEFEFKDLSKGTMNVGSAQRISEYLKQ